MKKQSGTVGLTELEGAALAIIRRSGARTAYEIKESFSRSPSSYWSGSAGAVYPMMNRLEGRGLLASRDASESRRPKRLFDITPSGRAALVEWILNSERASDAGYDPLRTRMAFIDLVDQKNARALLEDVESAYKAMAPPSDDDAVKSIHEDWRQMRMAWIQDMKARLG